MSYPINFSVTDDQADDLMDVYDVDGLQNLKEELRSDVYDFVEEKINSEK